MSAMNDANVKDLVIDHIKAIADALCGEEQTAYGGGDLLRHSLGRIADYLDDNPIATGASLPTVSSTDNGSILKVADGAWATGSETVELPAVTADDNGKVLTVVEGAWAAATPSSGK